MGDLGNNHLKLIPQSTICCEMRSPPIALKGLGITKFSIGLMSGAKYGSYFSIWFWLNWDLSAVSSHKSSILLDLSLFSNISPCICQANTFFQLRMEILLVIIQFTKTTLCLIDQCIAHTFLLLLIIFMDNNIGKPRIK